MTSKDIHNVVRAWRDYFADADWEKLIVQSTPRDTGCGLIYELENPIDRPNESVAICDTRQLEKFEPHYHVNETEIYIVLQGSGVQVVASEVTNITPGCVVIIPPETAHFTVPGRDLVMAVINTPPFDHENTRGLTQSDSNVKFDQDQYDSFFN